VKRVLVFGTYDLGAGYPRTRSLLQALAAAGVELVECRADAVPPRGARARTVRNPLLWPMALLRLAAARTRLRRELRAQVRAARPDCVLVAYPGHLAVDWARGVFDGPVVLDLFLSVFDTVVGDRGLLPAGGWPARALRWLDRRACRGADRVLLDTPEHAAFVAELTGLASERFGHVPVSDPDAPAAPARLPELRGLLEVLFVGSGVPLHGLPVLLDAVGRSRGVRLTLVGGSPAERAAAAALPQDRLRLLPAWVDPRSLHALLADCHVAAGIFSTQDKARRVVPFKVVHGLAAGRPVVTAGTPAVQRVLLSGRDVLTVRPGDVVDLCATFRQLSAEPERLVELAARSRPAYDRAFSVTACAERLMAELELLTGSSWPRPAATDAGSPLRVSTRA
jgi:glycosyltransferase involved in cell wall biosynthesis